MKIFSKAVLSFVCVVFLCGIFLAKIGHALGAKFPNSTYKEIHKELHVEDALKASNLNISINNSSLTIKNGNSLSVTGYGRNVTLQKENDTIELHSDKMTKQNFSSMFMDFSLWNYFRESRTQHLTLTIPKKHWDSITINGRTGTLYGNDLSGKEVTLSCGSGNLSIKNISTDSLNARCGFGNIDIKKLNASNNGILTCSSGNIDIGNKTNKESTIKNLRATCENGNIDITSKILGVSSVNSSLGNIDLTLTDEPNNYFFTTKTDSSNVSLPENYDTTKSAQGTSSKIYLSSDIGNIDIYFAK